MMTFTDETGFCDYCDREATRKATSRHGGNGAMAITFYCDAQQCEDAMLIDLEDCGFVLIAIYAYDEV